MIVWLNYIQSLFAFFLFRKASFSTICTGFYIPNLSESARNMGISSLIGMLEISEEPSVMEKQLGTRASSNNPRYMEHIGPMSLHL
jgi:hypothetical protein